MFKNVASQKVTFLVIDTATNAPKTGDAANITAYVSKDDGSVTVLGDTSATELDSTNALGMYSFDLTQAETNADKLLFTAKSSTSGVRAIPLLVYTMPASFTSIVIANGCVDADVERFAGSAGTFSSGRPEVNTTHAAGTAWGSGAITAGAIATGAIDRDAFAADTGLQSLRSNTAQSGSTSTTIKLDASASAVDDFYARTTVMLTGGTGVGQANRILTYVGSTKVATVRYTWATTPDNTTTFAIFPAVEGADDIADAVWDEPRSGHVTSGTFGEYVKADATLISGDSVAADNAEKFFDGTGYAGTNNVIPLVTTTTTATNVTTVNGLAAGVITNASLAADSGLKTIRSNTAQAGAATTITLDASASSSNNFYNNALIAITGGTGVGQARFITAYNGTTKVATVATWVTNPDNTSTFAILPFDAVAGATAPTAAQVATAVWQDLLAGSDFSTASSIGKLLKDDIDVAISSRLAPTVASRTLDVTATGAAGIDLGNVENQSTTLTLSGTTIATASAVTTVNGLAAGVITSTSIATGAIDADALAADAGTEIAAAVLAAAQSNPIDANVQEVNDVAITGVGTSGNPWGPA